MKVFKEYGIYTVFIHPELFNNIPEAKFTMEFMRGIQYFDLRNIESEDQLIEKLKQFKGVEDQVILINNHLNINLYNAIQSLSNNNYIIIFKIMNKSGPFKNRFNCIDQSPSLSTIFLYSSRGIIFYNNPEKLKFILIKSRHYKVLDNKKYSNFHLWNFRYHMYKIFCK